VDEGFLIPTALTVPILIENAVYYSPKRWFGGEKHMRRMGEQQTLRVLAVYLNVRVCATTANNITFCFVTITVPVVALMLSFHRYTAAFQRTM
jgi:hypothetical protein